MHKGAKYDAKNLERQFHDHAWYVAFAPAENPKIAIAVIVENGGSGSRVAAPMAQKVYDAWLKDFETPFAQETLAKAKAEAALNRNQPEILLPELQLESTAFEEFEFPTSEEPPAEGLIPSLRNLMNIRLEKDPDIKNNPPSL